MTDLGLVTSVLKSGLMIQGEVELISQMPPKAEKEGGEGMLEYLEDIIGTNKYIEDIKAAGTKLEELSEEKQKQIQRVKTAGADLRG